MFGTQQTSAGMVQTEEGHTEVTITPFGTIKVEGKNYVGDQCSLLGDQIRRALGGKPGDTSPKPEFFTSTDDTQTTNW